MDRSTILESYEDVFVLFHDLDEDVPADLEPLLLSDPTHVESDFGPFVARDSVLFHYR